jgi:hypothetical protein
MTRIMLTFMPSKKREERVRASTNDSILYRDNRAF